MTWSTLAPAAVGVALAIAGATANAEHDPLTDAPQATVDLGSREGVALMRAQWRYSDTRIIPIAFHDPGSDGQPTGPENQTYDFTPRAGARDFDDGAWQTVDPTTLAKPRGHGHLSFNWYRIRLTVPERVGGLATAGATLVFETQVDDYAEIWVDGELPHPTGQSGGPVVKGWNAKNRLIIGRDVQSGQQIQLAVFGINGPISKSPTNFIFLHYAKLEFHPGGSGPFAVTPHEVNVEVERLDPALDAIVPPNPKLWKLAEGFKFTEGPVWVAREHALLFSDPNRNAIYKLSDGHLDVFRMQSGYAGADIAEYGQPGSNGLTLDPQGRLTINEHGNHRVIRLEPDGRLTVLADSYQGKRLNSPNDLVYKSDGALYFTDPPFGLPKFFNDPRKQLPFSGVYRWKDGELSLLTSDFAGPNGIAFSPDERWLYVGDWDEKHKVVMRYPVLSDGSLGRGQLFYDMTRAAGEDAIDGIKIDVRGNVYVSGPGGLWVLSAEGKHRGTIRPPRQPHNMAWGDADGRTLFMTAEDRIYRMRLNIPGVRP
ncbi:MAG TPA: SMP-30/gluconolactonase/LRE family protein [Burkholderiales bacterium]|nr:SMP-30/gluconolactonase/LRE family protein [Burkholderiales bacterium]